jgi:N-acylglucosamine-6-phosphate 2-epimerase
MSAHVDRPHPAVEAVRGRLVVSCQAPPGDPLYGPETMAAMAAAVLVGGAAGIRANGLADVMRIRTVSDRPLIGLWKDGTEGVYITPTLDHALAVADAGADIVALDGTARPRPDARTLEETITALRARTAAAVLADVSTLEEGISAARAGAHAVSTTLAGYTPDSRRIAGPDLELVAELAAAVAVPVFAEGRIGTPAQARQAIDAGAWAAVVGTAITAPAWITARFARSLRASEALPG